MQKPPKKDPNHKIRLEVLRKMTPEQKLEKVFELNKLTKELFKHGLRKANPDLNEEELHKLYLERLKKAHNRNW
ncbi:MAG: hypothetical protein GF315_01885 [candidate division Zixibacteria bacterium]|nr:hypothetical protein [candidate division Zixibacteria bacterium]